MWGAHYESYSQKYTRSLDSIFSRLLFLLLVVNTLINLLIGGISRNFIKHQNMLHLEDSIHIYADSLNTELHLLSVLCTVLLVTTTIWQSSIPAWFQEFYENLKTADRFRTEFQYQMGSPITFS